VSTTLKGQLTKTPRATRVSAEEKEEEKEEEEKAQACRD
jgi:hypothetical protein